MFEDQYRKMNQELNPSEGLNDETVALMKEAQDHNAAEPPKRLRLKPAVVIPLAGTVAAVLVATVLLGFWLGHGRGTVMEDAEGSFDVIGGDQADSEAKNDASDSAASPENETPTINEEKEPSENEPAFGTTPPENQAPPQSETPPKDDGDVKQPQPNEDENEGEDEKEDEDSGSSAPVDPRDPDIVNDESTATYTTIREFLTALAQKSTPGYGKNYYNARDLLIVPAKLPEQARFRHMHLHVKDGSYSYSYLFANGGKEYFLDIEVDADTPKTLRDLTMKKQEIATEEIQTGQKGNQLFFLFGKTDYVTVTVTEVNSTILLNEEQVNTLLAQFELERCKITNALVDMKY